MANAPTVQSISDIMADLAPAYTTSENLINQQISNLGSTYAGKTAALDATKAREFGTINTQATNRGMAFSGIPLDEQATYLSTTYLPGMQELASSELSDKLKLQQSLADIEKEKYTSALSTQQTQQSALNQWNLQQQQEEFTAQQNALDRAQEAAEYAAENATVPLDEAIETSMAAAGTRYNSQGKIVSATNAAENTAYELSAAGYGSYSDILKKAYEYRYKTFGEK